MATGRLTVQEHSVDMAAQSYVSTSDFVELKGPNQRIHIIAGVAAPSTAHANAPTGSLYVMTAGTVKLYVKTDATTWTAQT